MAIINSISQLRHIFQLKASYATKLTIDEIYGVLQKHINLYYSEITPKEYKRIYKFLNSLIKTEVVTTGMEVSCTVEVNQAYLNYTYKGGASGADVWGWADNKSHGGTVKGSIEVWKDAIEELGGETGILNLMRSNLIKSGIPVI